MSKFNITLLAKQGWRIFNNLETLLARALKAKYFPSSNFLSASLGNLSSYTWKSLWAARGLLESGLYWRIGLGSKVSVANDTWLLGSTTYKLNAQVNLRGLNRVSDFINAKSM